MVSLKEVRKKVKQLRKEIPLFTKGKKAYAVGIKWKDGVKIEWRPQPIFAKSIKHAKRILIEYYNFPEDMLHLKKIE
jgi:hypothetical protein